VYTCGLHYLIDKEEGVKNARRAALYLVLMVVLLSAVFTQHALFAGVITQFSPSDGFLRDQLKGRKRGAACFF